MMLRYLWLLLGLLSLGLGLLGVVVPLLPTTPFLLLSAAAFAKSSPRLHTWLIEHPRWGVLIKNWQDGGRIDRRSKQISITVIVLMPLLSFIVGAPLYAIGIQVVILSIVSWFILSRPS